MKPIDGRVRHRGEVHVGLGDPADATVHERQAHLVVLLVELAQRVGDRLERALHVGLEHEVERGDLAALHHREDVLEAGAARQRHRVREARGTTAMGPGLGDRARSLVVGCDAELVAGERHVVETEHLDRVPTAPASGTWLAVLVEHRADPSPRAAGDDRVAHAQRAASTSTVTTGPRPWSRLRLEHEARARRLRVARELLDVGDEQDRVEQLVDAEAPAAGDLDDDRVAAPLLGHELLLDELLAHAVGSASSRSILVIATIDRHLGRACVADRLDRLGHHAVVGSDDEDGDVGRASRRVARIAVNASWPGVSMKVIRGSSGRPGTHRCAA